MTKKIFALVAIFINTIAFAQNDIDAMQYSQTTFYGDARFMSMGGAFGSLGANLSCLNFNPAGIAMYHKGEIVFTPGLKFQGENATHYGTSASDFSAKLNISNIGFVAAWDQQPRNPQTNNNYQPYNGDPYGPGSNRNQAPKQNNTVTPKTITQRNAIGISYNRIADFNYHSTISGYAPGSSIMNQFRDYANGYYPSQLNDFQEGTAYQTYLINPNTTADSSHYYAWPDLNNNTQTLKQTKTIQSSGRVGELAFGYAHSFSDKFYLGVSMGVPLVKYNYQSIYTEEDTKNEVPYFNSLQYQQNLQTSGAGFNFKGGGIYRFKSGVKVGVYAQSPTYYKLTDNYQSQMSASYDSSFIPASNGGVTNTASYTSAAGNYAYKLSTPGRVGGSISYVYGKLLAFSVDGEYVDYSNARFAETSANQALGYNSYGDVNSTIKLKYTATANIKAGVELNIRPIVIRAGFASYGSPFGDVLSGKFVRNSFTGGIGFRGAHSVYLDLGFAYTVWKEQYYVIDPMYVQPSNVNFSNLYVTATLGIKFN
ncbi:MAG: hypothetical protein ABI388_07155 [Bacteroidia bacterium]